MTRLRKDDARAVEPEGLAQLARDGLEDVHEVERARDLLEDLDHGEQPGAFALQLLDAGGQRAGGVGLGCRHGCRFGLPGGRVKRLACRPPKGRGTFPIPMEVS